MAIDTRNLVEGNTYGTYDDLKKYDTYEQTTYTLAGGQGSGNPDQINLTIGARVDDTAGPEGGSKKSLYVRNPSTYMLWMNSNPPLKKEIKPKPASYTLILGKNGRYY